MSAEEAEAKEVRRRNRQLRDEMRRSARAAGASPATMKQLGGSRLAQAHRAADSAALALLLGAIAQLLCCNSRKRPDGS
jgi:hypothetical protein